MKLHPSVTDAQVKSTFKTLEKRFYKVQLNKYTYENLQFKGVSYKGTITCPIHGNFEQTIHKHLCGRGCPECAKSKARLKYQKSAAEVIKECISVHGDLYDYSKVEYINNKIPITVICKIHGEFYPTAKNHIRGSKCPGCRKTGFDPNKPATLYYLSINCGQAYKIGITNKTLKERFNNSELDIINVIKLYEYSIGKDAYTEEQRILKEFKDYKYTGPDLLKAGNTELFSIDILNLDSKEFNWTI